jgi:hypothetical protein
MKMGDLVWLSSLRRLSSFFTHLKTCCFHTRLQF